MKSFFISSTFKDMQAERDILYQEVFPQIRRKLQKYGEDIQELDLRWGIDTSLTSEEENGRYIIQSCIDAIDHCRPYMIVLIGDRYGWIPDMSDIRKTNDARVIKWYQDEISITHMEIAYGVLEHKQFDRCIFCFRENSFIDKIPLEKRGLYSAESETHKSKLDELKTKIRESQDAIILDYKIEWDEEEGKLNGFSEFSDQLSEKLWEMISSGLEKKKITEEENILMNARFSAERYMKNYIPRMNMSGSSALLGRSAAWFYGVPGCGKSAYLASIYKAAESVENHAFLYYCGNENCSKLDTFLNTLLYWLRKENGKEELNLNELSRTQKLAGIYDLLKAERMWDSVLLIDGIDQMEEDVVDILIEIQKLIIRDKVEGYTYALVITSTEEFYDKNVRKIKFHDFMTRKIETIQETELVAFSQMHAKRRGKQLDAKVQNAVRAKKNAENPYYLSLLLQQLFMMDARDFEEAEALAPGMEGLSAFMEKKVNEAPESITEMTAYILKCADEKMSREEKLDSMQIFYLLAVSQQGFTLNEMYALLEMKGKKMIPAQMQKLFSYLYDSLYENKNGRWDFTHRLIRDSLLELMPQEEFKAWNYIICQYMQEQKRFVESFYYALCSNNNIFIENCIDAAINGDDRERVAYFAAYHSYLLKYKEEADTIAEISRDKYGWFISHIVLENTDQAMKTYLYWTEIIQKLQKEELSEKTRFYLLCAEFALKKYEYQEKELLTVWDKVSEQFFATKSLGNAERKAYYTTLITVISHQRFQNDYEKIIDRLDQFFKDNINVGLDERQTVLLPLGARELSKIMRMKRDKASPGEILKEVEKFDFLMNLPKWQECESLETQIQYLMHALYGQVASLYISERCYQEAFDILKKIILWYRGRIQFFPTIDERIQYAWIIYRHQKIVKAEYKMNLINAYRDQYHYLSSNYSKPFFEEGLAYSYLMEAMEEENFEKTDKVDFDRPRRILLAYREATERYEALIGNDKDNVDNYDYLEMLCYIRYRKVKRRLENDIWGWEEERQIAITKKAPYFEEKMERDLQDMIDDILIRHRLRNDDSILQELLASYIDGVRYYDYHQEPEKAFMWCQEVLDWEKKVNKNPTEREQWTRMSIFYYVSDCYIRYGKYEKARELMPVLFESMEKTYQKWVEPKDFAQAYLLLMKCSRDESLEKQEEYYNLAWEKVKDLKDESLNPLKSDLKQTLAEAYYRAGNIERASNLLELSSWLWNSMGTLYFKMNEAENQKIFRYLCGQSMLARMDKNKKMLHTIIRKYKYILENYTSNKDIGYRPLLLKEVQKIKNYYDAEYPDDEIPEELEYLLLGNEEARKARKGKSFDVQEKQKSEELNAYIEEGGDLTSTFYYKLLQELLELQGNIADNLDKRSKEYEEVFEKNIRTVEKLNRYHWSVRDYRKALRYEYFIMAQFEHRKELLERMYSVEECWNHWCELKKKHRAVKYINRMAEVDWANMTMWGQEVCYRYFEETKDPTWLYQAAQEAKEYCAYMNQRMNDNPEDEAWNHEAIREFYSKEQDAYLKIQKSGLVEEKEWLDPFIRSIDKQLDMKTEPAQFGPEESFYTKKLKILYQLQELNLKGQDDIQKVINKVIEKQGKTDYKFQYYIQKAVKELGSDATVEAIQKYVNEQKEKDKSV